MQEHHQRRPPSIRSPALQHFDADVSQHSPGRGFTFQVLLLLVILVACVGAGVALLVRGGSPAPTIPLFIVAAICAGLAFPAIPWLQLVAVVGPDVLTIRGPSRRSIGWERVASVREVRGPAGRLRAAGLLPGPRLLPQLWRDEVVLEIATSTGERVVLRRAVLAQYEALRDEVLLRVPDETHVDLRARWWRLDQDASSPNTGP